MLHHVAACYIMYNSLLEQLLSDSAGILRTPAAANGSPGIHDNGHFSVGSHYPLCFGQHHT